MNTTDTAEGTATMASAKWACASMKPSAALCMPAAHQSTTVKQPAKLDYVRVQVRALCASAHANDRLHLSDWLMHCGAHCNANKQMPRPDHSSSRLALTSRSSRE
jgi:hypothetical protein